MSRRLRICVGDIGSNAIKTRLVEVDGHVRRKLVETRFPVRLGSSVFTSGCISEELIAETVSAFREVAAQCATWRVELARIVATSATREATNGAELVAAVRKATDLQIDIISGAEEAQLLALAVRPDLRPGVSNIVLDVGGGSTELIRTDPDLQIVSAETLPLGAVRLAQLAGSRPDQPLGRAGCEAVRRLIAEAYAGGNAPASGKPLHGVGAAGTVGAILAARNTRSYFPESSFTCSELETILTEAQDLAPAEIAERYRLDIKRAQVLLPGAHVVLFLMEELGLHSIAVSRCGLRDGILEGLLAGIPQPPE